jgi:hypothetical protein
MQPNVSSNAAQVQRSGRARAVALGLSVMRMGMIVGMLHAPVVDMGVSVGGEIHGVPLFDAPKFPNADRKAPSQQKQAYDEVAQNTEIQCSDGVDILTMQPQHSDQHL